MANYSNYYLPDDRNYVFIDPVSFFWAKKAVNSKTDELKSIFIGFTELITRNLNKNELRFNFRSEKLSLRANKPFLRLLARNKYFEFLSPWKCSWKINPNLQKTMFIDHPYDHYIIECYDFESTDAINQQLKLQSDLVSQINKLIEKDVFADCKDCPDFFQSNVTRRIANSKENE